ncbi:hypothetical protein KFK09_008719 [Dendrobium nobile]|uniref:Reverse transcriptase domain-containing protein n=1 Tax=Dendrobium nobile TaxID=94219 RepID=A0A8T3BLX6_DENNO|nr:hypothetical protein KFK09_008719 [Dendrobium nobile]
MVNLFAKKLRPGNRWIRFEDIWMTYPVTWRLVWKNWNKDDFGMPDEVVNRKCSRTMKALFFWSRNRLKELNELKISLESRIEELQLVDCSPNGLNEEQEHELRLKAIELNTTLARLATWWKQRAKARWIDEGDTNSHFFHSFASARRRGNRIIDVVNSNGERIVDPNLIQEEFWNFFMLKWRDRQVSLANWPEFCNDDMIPAQFSDSMEADITESEIRQAMFSMGNNRAPGIDGITSSFMKFYWEIIKKDVISAILHFFATNMMCQSWKETLVVLIPKLENANMPSKFRPISLCQSFYKIVAKVLINRLKPVLGTIISEEQGAFVPGRSISSHGLMAQEVMSKFKYSTQKSGLMALKIDMEQAYDCMSWETLQEVMNLMGFKKRFITWVMQCIFEPKFTLLMNGNRTRWIDAKSGLRQGCPLSPYLFILCSELLSKSFKQRGGQLGVQVARNTVSISHLLYADDILVFAEASRCNARRIMDLLGDYCCWTGQKINCGKSAIMFNRKCPSWRKRMIARIMGYKKVDSLEYLGLPLVMRRLNGADFSKIMRIAFEKINLWGRKHLSLAGRALLIKTSLLYVPMYAMTHTSIPNGVLMAIEKWGGGFYGRKMLAAWKGALRARVVWDLIQNKDSILYKVLMAKYGMKLWEYEHGKKVSITWNVIQDGARVLRPILRWNIVDGSQIDVMHDVWIMNRNIAKLPTFVNIEEVENMKVCNLLNNSFQWNVEMVKHCFGNTMAERILAINISTKSQEDNPELIYSRLSMTVAAMAYRNSEEKGTNEFSWLKQLKLHPREHFFWGRLLRDAIPTTHWLNRRTLADTSLCPWGCNEEENLDHCSTRCTKLKQVMDIFCKWGFNLPDVNSLVDLKVELLKYAQNNPSMGRIYCYTVYQVWRARNDMKHHNMCRSPFVIATAVLFLLPKPFKWPMLEQWGTNQPLGLPSHKLWCPPPPGWLKLNFDAALLPSNQVGLGVIARNHYGKLVVAAGRRIEHWDVLQAEMLAAMAIREVFMDWMFELDGIIIEGDCINAIRGLQRLNDRQHVIHRRVAGLDTSFLQEFKQVLFQYTHRNSNRVVDFCAHLALGNEFTFFDVNNSEFPSTLLSLLREESDRLHLLGFIDVPIIGLGSPLSDDVMDLYEKSCDTFALQYGDFVAHKKAHKDLKTPFVMPGCKVTDDYGIMLVTAVGINTEWGLLMASISEGSGEYYGCCSCEIIGSTTSICNDKTGILTLNHMTVVEAHVGGVKLTSPDNGQELSSSVYSLLYDSIA